MIALETAGLDRQLGLRASAQWLAHTAFAGLLTILIWSVAITLIQREEKYRIAESEGAAANMALTLMTAVSGTSSELDRLLKYLRATHDATGNTRSWQNIITAEYAANPFVAQIAVIDSAGMMITSTAMLYPPEKVDLSDREHFIVHKASVADKLYISAPVRGRASGRWTIQFTRPLIEVDGAFGGVLVVSLDPEKLVASYRELALGDQGGIAVYGNDDIIRAGMGRFDAALGQKAGAFLGPHTPKSVDAGSEVFKAPRLGVANIVVERKVPDYPLTVVVATDGSADALWARRVTYCAFASLLTLISVSVAMFMYHARKRHDALVAERNKLTVQQEASAAAGRAREEFLAVMTHEIRTPINGILGALDLLRGEKLSERALLQIAVATQSGELLQILIEDILAFSKLRQGKLDLNPTPTDIAELVSNVESALQPAAAKAGNVLRLRLSLRSGGPVLIDSVRLRQVLNNFVGNAMKFTRDGEVTIEVEELAAPPESRRLRFAVSDTGIGIPRDKQAIIFDAFQSLDASYTRRTDGTGLGLAICDGIVRAMDAEIIVESEPGQGSRFWFEISCPPAEPGRIISSAAEPTPTTRPLKILLAEDNPTNQYIATEFLTTAGHTVVHAENGVSAVEQASSQRFDVILMDISMPIMDGFEATSLIRAGIGPNRQVPIIALTAHIADDGEKYRAAGMTAWLSKPVRKERLLSAVAAAEPSGVAPHTSAGQQILDREHIAEFVEERGGERAAKLIGLFIAELNSKRDQLEAASTQRDSEAMKRLAHSIVGSAGAIGAVHLAALARSMEEIAQWEKIPELERAINDTLRALQPLSASHPAGLAA